METASDLETVKWLLVAILAGVALIAIAAIAIAAIFWHGLGILHDQTSGKVFRAMAEDYLAKNENAALTQHIDERLKSHPQDVWAHWYRGQVNYQSGKLAESKRCFERVIELEPGWHESARSWLDKINAELDRGPQLVE